LYKCNRPGRKCRGVRDKKRWRPDIRARKRGERRFGWGRNEKSSF